MNLKSLNPLGLLALLATTLAVTTAGAQTTWYLSRAQTNNEYFNTVSLWKDAPSGGMAATEMDNTATYDTNQKTVLRSRNQAADTFAGGNLVLNQTEWQLKTVTATVGNLSTSTFGAELTNFQSGPSTALINNLKLVVTNFTLNGSFGIYSTFSDRSLALDVTTLTGTGNLLIGGARQINSTALTFSAATLKVTNASNYTGSVIVGAAASTLSFASDFSSGGALKLTTGGTLNLANNLSFAGGIFIDDQLINLDAGNYDYASLVAANGSFANVITDNGGHILVSAIPEPSTFAVLAGFSVLMLGVMARRRAR